MSTIVRTVVAWDDTAPGHAALRWALDRDPRGRIELVAVLDESRMPPGVTVDDALTAAAGEALERAVSEARSAAPDASVSSRVIVGDRMDVLREQTAPDTLLVIGTHDRGGFLHRFGWSLGARLAGVARGPLAVVPEAAPALPPGRIVVGIDGSVGASRALLVAAREASRRHQTLHVVHAWEPPVLPDDSFALDAEAVAALRAEHRRIVDDAVATARSEHPGLDVRGELRSGEAARVLVESHPEAGLVVVGSRGRSALRRLMLGSVAHDVVLGAFRPVLVVPAEHLAGEQSPPEVRAAEPVTV